MKSMDKTAVQILKTKVQFILNTQKDRDNSISEFASVQVKLDPEQMNRLLNISRVR